jgi:phospholipid/cholesterol/gamma-HCH transport system substrate-binding protein
MSVRKPMIGFALFAILSLFVTWVMWGTLQRSVSGSTTSYSATFSNVLGLVKGDDVRIAGVRVGRVRDIALDAKNNATVTFIVQSDQQLYANTKALVRYRNLIGQRYVALEAGAGSAAPLVAGANIPVTRTEPSFDVALLLGGFQPLFQLLRPAQVNELSDALIVALQGDNGVSLASFITQAAQVATEFQNRDVVLGSVIDNLSSVITGLANHGTQLETLIDQAKALVGGLYAQGKSLEADTAAIAGATTSLVRMIDRVTPGLAAAQDSTNAALRSLIGNGARLDRAAVEVPPVLTGVARWTGQGAYSNAYSCTLDVSLWNVLLPPGLTSQIGGTKHSVVCQ